MQLKMGDYLTQHNTIYWRCLASYNMTAGMEVCVCVCMCVCVCVCVCVCMCKYVREMHNAIIIFLHAYTTVHG